ncbi:MAG: sulfatase [Verrucomicrobiota bacterium]
MKSIIISFTLCCTLGAAAEKPNILFFLVDDMGWQETSVAFHTEPTQLNRDYHTPNMERLVSSGGMMFTNAYAASVCSPSRTSLMTGWNAARHKVTCWTLKKDASPENVPAGFSAADWPLNGLQPVGSNVPHSVEAPTLPQLLREAGYKTIHAGKAHWGAKDTPGADPKNLGFDVNIAGNFLGGPGSYYGEKNFSARSRNGGDIWDVPGLEKYHGQEINLTEAITREAIAALTKTVKEEKKPFYLYMSHYTIHVPWDADKRFIGKYQGKPAYAKPENKAALASMIESMDHSLGDLMDTLEKLGVADNTIIVFMSDNGSPQQCQPNLPLRGWKISGYEGGTRVPMIVKVPGITKGVRTRTPIIIEDIFPTFLQWARVKNIPENDGVSFTEILKNPSTNRSKRPLFWHYPNFYGDPPFSSVRLGDLKLIYWHKDQRLELFNLANDLGEKHNLAASRQNDVKRLAKVLADHLRKTKAVMPIVKATGKPVPLPDEVNG